jgi:hypothetical protein
MPLSSFIRKTVVFCSLAVAVPGVSFGQAAYSVNGGEYGIAPALPGDQAHPQLAVNANGGFLIWEDNLTDGRGLGISALALDNNFNRVGSRFRVNQVGAGDQSRPQVALFNGGGAAFVFQGGKANAQHIWARFLSASNTWITGDVAVNTFNQHYQITPSVAVLGNGNLVVVWGSFNQFSSTSMQDVYGQILSPGGQKIGGEFLVNQFTAFNQRTPSVTALAGGGFVVTWVSEQQQQGDPSSGSIISATNAIRPSIDIYARLFDGTGSAVGDEFRVNTSLQACANPVVASGADGGFVVAWAEREAYMITYNTLLRTNQLVHSTNSWDIYARSFSSVVSGGAIGLVNTHRYGDQFAPQISSIGASYLVAWTSLGQDGSREGVYGQFLNADASTAGSEFRVNTTTVGPQMHPSIASDGSQRFLAVWTGFAAFKSGLDLFAQMYSTSGWSAGPSVATYQAPAYDPFPSDPVLGPGGLDFPVKFAAFGQNILANALAQAQGAYHGLFYDPSGVAASSAGYFSATTTAAGKYSAKLSLGMRTYVLNGTFSASTGFATNTIGRGASAVTVVLQLDLSGGNEIRGRISGPGWSAFLQADHQTLVKKGATGAYAGSYALVLPPADSGPGGDSFGTIKVDAAGNVRFIGTLADGTKVSQSSAISDQGIWPLYASIYGGKGSIIGWIQFATNSALSGNVLWLKPAGVMPRTYPGGFTNSLQAAGSAYSAPPVGKAALDLPDGSAATFSGGGLAAPFSYNITLNARNKIIGPPASKFTLSLSAMSGLFNGAAVNPSTGNRVSFQGILWQGANAGVGYFVNGAQTGEVTLEPAP